MNGNEQGTSEFDDREAPNPLDRGGRPRTAEADAMGLRRLRHRRGGRPRERDQPTAQARACRGDDGPGLAARTGRCQRRLQAAEGDPRAGARHQGDRAHRPARSRKRREGRGHGRLRLLRQALRARTAQPDDRPRIPHARPAKGKRPPLRARGQPAVRSAHTRPGHAQDLQDDRKDRIGIGDRRAPRRERDGQGDPRPRPACAVFACA